MYDIQKVGLGPHQYDTSIVTAVQLFRHRDPSLVLDAGLS